MKLSVLKDGNISLSELKKFFLSHMKFLGKLKFIFISKSEKYPANKSPVQANTQEDIKMMVKEVK